jgi:hypothetical protein
VERQLVALQSRVLGLGVGEDGDCGVVGLGSVVEMMSRFIA